MNSDLFIIKSKCIIIISIALLLISVGLQSKDLFQEDDYEISYEYVNIKDMAQASVKTKENSSNILNTLFTGNTSNGAITEVSLPTTGSVQEVELPTIENTDATENVETKQIWYLPTEVGTITQYPHYGHAAYDITSSRTYSENIFPVANGVISGIYTDPAGAKVVTILHEIDGVKYTSQYAHMSQYASGLYVGKEVTVNDSIGLMGSTGNSTGPHLHIAVADCALFDSNDTNCSDLNGWFRYVNSRLNQGYIGLGSHINMPNSWTSR